MKAPPPPLEEKPPQQPVQAAARMEPRDSVLKPFQLVKLVSSNV